MVQEYGLFIDGKWRTSEGKRFETRNPATGEVLATFPLATNDELGGAAHAAKGAFEKWRKTPAPRRGEILLEAARIFRRKKEELGRVVTTEMGKVIGEGRRGARRSGISARCGEPADRERLRRWGRARGSSRHSGHLLHGRCRHRSARVRDRGEEDDQSRTRVGRQESDHRDGRREPRPPHGRCDVRRLWNGGATMHPVLPSHRPSEKLPSGL